VVGEQAMVTKVVENQDTTSTKHQKQVALSGVVKEHNLIPYNMHHKFLNKISLWKL
jgi:hypothetical protein